MKKPLRTNRSIALLSTVNIFDIAYYIFIVYTSSTLFTIVNAVQPSDNEAIIQLSIDSIHVVKSSDSRFTYVEDKTNDNDERELLIALLSSFDDEDHELNKIDRFDSSSHGKKSDRSTSIDNCSSSSIKRTTGSTNTLRFVPDFLDFNEQPISIPRMQTVIIINEQAEPIELQSLSGTTVHFYSSFFSQKQLSANGGNTTIHVYFLPRSLGLTKSTFTVQTNHGVFQYSVRGIGTLNPFHLRPLIGATIPLNSTFEYSISFYNPYNQTLEIEEIYTSDENLILELLSHRSYRNRIKNSNDYDNQWHLEAFQTKTIFKLHYLAHKLDRLHGFYCIKTNRNDTIIVPVEINVLNGVGLYSNVDLLEFSPDGFVRSVPEPITVPVYATNNGNKPVTISDVRIATTSSNSVDIDYKTIKIPADIHRLTKVADLILNPGRIPKDIDSVYGTVNIYASENDETSSKTTDYFLLEIPFYTTILHGSLDVDSQSNNILVPSLLKEKFDETKQICQPIRLINRFNVPLTVFNISIEKFEIISTFVRFKISPSYSYVQPQGSISPLCVSIIRRSSPNVIFLNMETTLILNTNLSFFRIPLHFYSGLLSLTLINDHRNGGIRLNETNPLQFIIASIPVRSSRTVHFAVSNTNPVDITIERITKIPANSVVRLCELRATNGTVINIGNRSLSRNDPKSSFTIPAGFQAVISLTVTAGDKVDSISETLSFQTSYQLLTMHVKYKSISHPFEINNNAPLGIDAFINRPGTLDFNLHNNFDLPIDMKRIDFPTFGKCFSFLWNSSNTAKLIVPAHQTHKIGQLTFDMTPLCSPTQIPLVSKSYCGLNFQDEFSKRWEEHVALLNTKKLDYGLVTEFRNLWKEWMILVRKQRLEINLWLTTDLGDISLPLTVNFIWPSVLEYMWSSSVLRTPIIMDFHLVLVNRTKTQNVIINNPSSIPLSYEVELIPNYDKKSKVKSAVIESAFNLSNGSNFFEIDRGIYRFTLEPKEHLILTVNYRPKFSIKDEAYLIIRNDFTQIESVLMRGEGASASLTVGNRQAGSSDIPLIIEMTEKESKFCLSNSQSDGRPINPSLRKIVTLRNTGNIKIIIHEISFGDAKCSGQGFSVSTCLNIEIEPEEHHDLIVGYQPDYTLAEIRDILTLNTSIGRLTFPLIVRIPQRVLTLCYRVLPRPNWESRTSYLCIFSIPIFLILIIGSAITDARGLFYKYFPNTKAQFRKFANEIHQIHQDQLLTTETSSKSNQSSDSQTQSAANHVKRENTNHESKSKSTENKSKRSTPINNNGTKDNTESTSKTVKNSDINNPVTRTVPSPKPVVSKGKKTTNESSTTKTSKPDGDNTNSTSATSKLSVGKTQKMGNNYSTSNPYVNSSTSSSGLTPTSLSDEEDEPFQPARTKRITSRAKENNNTMSSVKTSNNSEDSLLKRPNSLSSNQISSSPTNSKITTTSDLNEPPPTAQQQLGSSDQKESTPSSVNEIEQRSLIQNSQRTQRKSLTNNNNKREIIADEPQTNIRANKIQPTNGETQMSSGTSLHTGVSIPLQAARFRRSRRRRSAREVTSNRRSFLSQDQKSKTREQVDKETRESLFRQLTEQLWSNRTSTSVTNGSLSVRSRCSSAPPSERGCDVDRENVEGFRNINIIQRESFVEWDEPATPDLDFGRYISQSEELTDGVLEIDEWIPSKFSAANDIPSLMSLPTDSFMQLTTDESQISLNVLPMNNMEQIESVPIPHHGPGPIQRPNKLITSTVQPTGLTNNHNTMLSPASPDVLDQINKLMFESNPSNQGTSMVNSVNNPNSSSMMADLTSPVINWSPFCPSEWQNKQEQSWLLSNMQSSPIPINGSSSNPFVMVPPMVDHQRQTLRSDAPLWNPVLNTVSPRLTATGNRVQPTRQWHETFPSSSSPTNDSNKLGPNGWLKFWNASDSSPNDGNLINRRTRVSTNAPWDFNELSGDSVVPISNRPQDSPSSQVWWSSSSSDENNNKNSSNYDSVLGRDQSRWDFAR